MTVYTFFYTRTMEIEPYKVKAHINGHGDIVGVVDAEKPARRGGKLLRFRAEGMRARWISDATATRFVK